MANPIIKIKRGFGTPGTWNSGDGTGITAGEFGFDRTTGILYLGLSGAGFKPDGTANGGGNAPIVIPIGMQISSDATFTQAVGYSPYTVPTTKAVKDYVSFVKQVASAGYTLYAGEGIRLDYFDPNNIDQGLTVVNIGVIKGFTSFGLGGNVLGNSRVYATNAVDGITLVAGSGIVITGNNSNRTLTFLNDGVTSINGVTGIITTFNPFVLPGFTQAVGLATNFNVSHVSPISLAKSETGQLEISHLNSGVNAGSYNALINNKWYIPNITVNVKGHVESITSSELIITPSSISGITQTVQDIIYRNLSTSDGLTLIYDDNNDRATLFNRGITSISASGGPGLTGNVVIAGEQGIAVTSAGKTITLKHTAPAFSNIAVSKGSDLENSGVWVGGSVVGNSAVADVYNDTLRLYAGKGIGLSAGESTLGSDYLLLWNSGLNSISLKDSSGNNISGGQGLSGDLVLAAGSNISFSVVPADNKISISSSGGGSGTGSLVADYKVEGTSTGLTQQYVGNGVTGIIDVVGLDGIITKQDTQTTSNGDLYIGLSSRLSLPARQFPGYEADPTNSDNGNQYDLPVNYPAFIRVPATNETTGAADAYSGVSPALPIFVPVSGTNSTYVNSGLVSPYNRIEVEEIQSGQTANVTNFQSGTPYGLYNLSGDNVTVPGKVLRLVAKSGFWEDSSGLNTLEGNQAEIRLLGFPSAEHLGSELESIVQNITSTSATYNPCTRDVNGDAVGTGCRGMPTKLPTCIQLAALGPGTDGFDLSNEYHPDASANRPTTKFNTNVVVTESLLVHKDIWLAGNILNAETGCLYSPSISPGGQNNAATCIECLGEGSVGVTGSLRVDKNLLVKGNNINFTGIGGQTFSVDFNVITLGGITGDKLAANSNWRQSDRGLLIQNRAGLVGTPLNNSVSPDSVSKSSFVGIDHQNGVFTYIPDASWTPVEQGGVSKVEYVGAPGPAHFASINGVGITNDTSTNSGAVTLRVGTPAGSLTTDAEIKGNVTISGVGGSSRQKINIANSSALINYGSSAALVDIQRGLTFDSFTTNSGNQNSLVIMYTKPITNTPIGRVTFRSPASTDTWTEVVDTGRYLSAGGAAGNNTYTADAAQQIIYNKTLADNTLIDCGSY